MNTESTFTASSGASCNYEVSVDENGQASANILWIGAKPTPEDISEFEAFLLAQADQAGFEHDGAQNIMLGGIKPEGAQARV